MGSLLRKQFEEIFPVPEGVFWCDKEASYMPFLGFGVECANNQNRAYEGWCAAMESRVNVADAVEKAVEWVRNEYFTRSFPDSGSIHLFNLFNEYADRKGTGWNPSFAEMSEEALVALKGMVDHCINSRLCMGMDEGFVDFETEEEHPFVKELRAFVMGECVNG